MRDLKLSILNKGFYEPILVWDKENTVLSGNHRVLAARALVDEGYTFVSPSGKKNVLPVVIESVPDEVAEAILYETNNSYAEWVEEKLKAAMFEAQEAGRNLREFGFTDNQINDLLQTSMKEAEAAVAREGAEYEEKTEEAEEREKGDTDAVTLEAWLLPTEIHDRVLSAFGQIADAISPHRSPTDSLVPAVEVFCSMCEDETAFHEFADLLTIERE